MIRALNTAASGMAAQETRIDVISNNLANVNTTGFKKARAEFQDLLYETVREPGATAGDQNQLPTGMQVGRGVRPVATHRHFSMGSVLQTGNALDLAIEGDGFFQVQQTNGELAYTRDGAFKTDGQGRVVTGEGMLLDPALVVPQNVMSVTVASDGTVAATVAGQAEPVQIGRIELARFLNPAGLKAIGRNLYTPTGASGQVTIGVAGQNGIGALSQGFLEGSNVKIVEEMIDLISTQRAYETNSKVIQAADEMLRSTTNLR